MAKLHDKDYTLFTELVETQKDIATSLSILTRQVGLLLADKPEKETKVDLIPELIKAIKELKLETVINNVAPAATKTVAKKTTAKK